MVELVDIRKAYGGVAALKGVNLAIEKGEFLGIVGPNGAGKTTLLRIIVGAEKPSSGRVLINSKEPSEADWIKFRKKVGFMPERVSFYDNLTGLETLRFFARIKGYGEEELQKVLSLNLLPEESLRRKVGGYSKGMRQRINLMQAFLGSPELLIMDEPTSGLDPDGVRTFYGMLEDLRGKVTIIVSTHILAEIEGRVDRIAVLKDGTLKAVGSIEDLYLGLDIPVRFYIKTMKEDNVEDYLKKLGAKKVTRRKEVFIAEVPAVKKLDFLRGLFETGISVKDVNIKTPSLEEVFFGAE